MKNIIFISFLFALFSLGCTVTRDFEVVDFETCALVEGRVLESYPRQCIHDGVTYVEDISNREYFCTSEQRNVDACAEIYQPVCAKVNIQCITTPCDPINQTFSNSCEACKNSLVESYFMGECENETNS